MTGFIVNMDFSAIKPNEARGGGFPPSDTKLGWAVQMVDSYTKENSKKNGMLGVFKLEGLDNDIKGQFMDYQINLANPNQQAQDIGIAEFSAIAHVVGILRVGNAAELHGKPFRVLVRKQKDNPEYVEIYGVQDINGNAPGKAGQGAVAASTTQQQQFGGNQGGGNNQGGFGGGGGNGGGGQGFGGPANNGGGGFGGGNTQGGGFGGPNQGQHQDPGQGQGGGNNGGGTGWNPNPGGGAVDQNANQGGNGGGGGWQGNGGGGGATDGQPGWAKR